MIRTSCSRCSVSGFWLGVVGLRVEVPLQHRGEFHHEAGSGGGALLGGGIKLETHYFGGAKWST